MSVSRKPRTDTGHPPAQQSPQQNTNSGEGSDSALAAMLKKRREGENHPDDGPDRGAENTTAER